MTDTTPDYARMIDLINVLTRDEEHDAKETCDKSAEAIRTLLESNKALMRERTNLIETKREQIGRLNTRIAELERERNQLLDKLHCMCGSPIDHSAWEGHTPVSVYDYSLDQERSRAEAAEARLAEARKLIRSTHKRAVTHTNCEDEFCAVCVGGLFICADCGAVEAEAEERICTACVRVEDNRGK